MVLRGAQIRRCGLAKCSLLSTRSLLHDLAQLYDRASLFTSTGRGREASPYLNAVKTWIDSHSPKSLSAIRSIRYKPTLPRNRVIQYRRDSPGSTQSCCPNRFDVDLMG
jgi:hypothetical protein